VQNFARAFDVFFQTKEETRELVWATSWGVSTRLMGALVMTHADDAGLRYTCSFVYSMLYITLVIYLYMTYSQ
jgi:prolyl-tRNA synthetase